MTSISQKLKSDPNLTDFRKKVYLALLNVPQGKVITYALLGKLINCNCPQAIGQALKNNPYAPDVPCHRVIKSDLSIGGFHGEVSGKDIDKKLALLSREGVIFDNNLKLIDTNDVFSI
ncbi:MAG: MGMT family protein [Kiritimatiellae bacterium]|jgi:methylated-DNA-[protein]-cysteine S-methyltransferase|nr:MGMT family protein [Kiritimatiellia bacterium]